MRAFSVKKGTAILVIKEGQEWNSCNFSEHETSRDNLFFLEDMVVDPTGISDSAAIPGCVTIGSHFAELGYYGFKRDGWIALVSAPCVTVH